MRTLIIGGTGFIGSHVASALARRGDDVVVAHRGRTGGAPTDGVAVAHADDEDPAAIAAVARDFGAEIVVDQIAMTEARTAPLLDALRGRIARYVLISSIDVYKVFGALRRREACDPHPASVTEDAPLRDSRFPYRGDTPRRPGKDLFDRYDKVPVERIVRQADLPWTILRLPFVYGPRDRQLRLSGYVWRIAERRPVLPIEVKTADWRMTHDYVSNAASAIALAATHPAAEFQVFNLGEETALSQREWASEICRATGGTTEIRDVAAASCPPHLLRLSGLFDLDISMLIDSKRLRGSLGYSETVARDEALRRTIEACLRAGRPRGLRHEYAAEDKMFRALGWTPRFTLFRRRLPIRGQHD